MTLYSRSDVALILIPAEIGGCGEPHSRPVIDGAPQHPWALPCSACEDYLRVHMPDQWSATTTEIPETHDEKLAREKAEKSGKLDRENQMAAALVELAKLGQLPEAIGKAFAQIAAASGAAVQPLAGMLECPSGHATAAPAKFCAECGAALSQPAPAAAIAAPQQSAGRPPAREPSVKVPRMRDGRIDVLKAFAAANGLDDTGPRSDLISRLSNAGLTARWAAFAAPHYAGPLAA